MLLLTCRQGDHRVTDLSGHWLSSLLPAPAWLPLIQAAGGVHVYSVCVLIFFGPVATWGMSSHGGSLECRRASANTGASQALGLRLPPTLHQPSPTSMEWGKYTPPALVGRPAGSQAASVKEGWEAWGS